MHARNAWTRFVPNDEMSGFDFNGKGGSQGTEWESNHVLKSFKWTLKYCIP